MRTVKSADKRREEITMAALELFTEKGYSSTSVKDITEKAKIAQGLFHYYYDSKEAVLAEVIDVYNNSVIEKINLTNQFPDDMDAIAKMNKFLEIMFDHVNSRSQLFCELSNMRDAVMANSIIIKLAESCCEKISQFVEQGVNEKVFDCPDPKLYTEIIVYGFVARFKQEMAQKGEFIEFTQYFRKNLMTYLDVVMRLFGMKSANGLFWQDIKAVRRDK